MNYNEIVDKDGVPDLIQKIRFKSRDFSFIGKLFNGTPFWVSADRALISGVHITSRNLTALQMAIAKEAIERLIEKDFRVIVNNTAANGFAYIA